MKDNYEFIKCPACGQIMKKVYLENQGFMVDICLDGCGGLWLDNRELNKLDEQKEDITTLKEAYKGKTFKKVDKTETRECPLCHKPMVKNNVSAKQEILIDECYLCGGKFFDKDELEQMRAQYHSDDERIADVKRLAQDSHSMQIILETILSKEEFGQY